MKEKILEKSNKIKRDCKENKRWNRILVVISTLFLIGISYFLIKPATSIADMESSEDWRRTFENVKLTGVWSEDVLAIAETQIGYKEGPQNDLVEESGNADKSYSRYGEWYGIPYGNWCAMFCSFCLNYAGVDTNLIPLESGCQKWILKLKSSNLYHDADSFDPRRGDLVFFDNNADNTADQVGFVYKLMRDEDNNVSKIKTIEGSGGIVGYHTYDLNDTNIMGYGELLENPTPTKKVVPSDSYTECLCGMDEKGLHAEYCPLLPPSESVCCERKIYGSASDETVVSVSGILPVDAKVKVDLVQITNDELIAYLGKSKADAVKEFVTYDIKIMVGNEEWQPNEMVSVSIEENVLDIEKGEIPNVAHIDNIDEVISDRQVEVEANSVIFETEGFSKFLLYTYTVDFHLGADVYTIPGNSSVMLSEIFEELSLSYDVTDVVNVTFSSPELISVEHVETDWKLTSLRAFSTDEVLTIELSDGTIIGIDTTDEPIIGSYSGDRLICSGDIDNFMQKLPFTTVYIDRNMCDPNQNSDFVFNNYGDKRYSLALSHNGGGNVQNNSVWFSPSTPITPGTTRDVPGQFSMSFPNAAKFSDGSLGTVIINYSNLKVTVPSFVPKAVTKVNFTGWIANGGYAQMTCIGHDSGDNLRVVGCQQTINITITKSDGSTVKDEDSFIMAFLDIDGPNFCSDINGSVFTGEYVEHFSIISGAKSQLYVPETCKIKILSNVSSNDANGLMVQAVSGADTSGTYNTGGAYVTSANGTTINYGGSNCGGRLFEPSTCAGIRPNFRTYSDGKLSDWIIGEYAGNIEMTDDATNVAYTWNFEESNSKISNHLTRYMGFGKDIPVSIDNPKEGFVLYDLTDNGKSAKDSEEFNSKEGKYTAKNIQNSIDNPRLIDVFYSPILGEVTITKKDKETGALLTGAEFTMTGRSSIHGLFTLKSIDNKDGTYTIKNVPYGKDSDIYKISETQAPKGYLSAPDQTVRGSEFTVNGENIKLEFEDSPAFKNLKISKTVIGTGTGSFPFKVIIKDGNDKNVVISNDAANPAAYIVNKTTGEITFSLSDGESTVLKGIPVGSKVTIIETNHDGYTTKVMEGIDQLSNTDKVENLIIDTNRSITYYNNSGTTLPETGGMGTGAYTWISFFILMSGFMYSIYWRYRRERRIDN